MKIDSKDFRVREGDEVDLKKWPTKVDPVYKSKEQYQEALGEHVAAERAAAAALCVQPPCRPADFPGHGCGGQRRRHQARDVRGQSAGLPGVQLQASQRRRTAARFSLAHHPRPAGTRADRHLQPILLRGGADRPRASRRFCAAKASRIRRTTTRRSGTTAIVRSWIWRDTSTPTAPASSNSSCTSRRRSSASAFSRASTSRKRTGNSALADIEERKYWKQYMKAYEECLGATSTRRCALVCRSGRRQGERPADRLADRPRYARRSSK